MMNKKEKAAYDEAIKAVYVARALNWSMPVEPDVPAPKNGGMGEARGFVFNAYKGGGVSFALSSSIGHATNDDSPPKKTTSQNPINMYSTRLLALRGLRVALEREYANNLAKIDMEIEKEQSA